MKALYITGFMGAGKTTVGKALGERWGVPVFDTDQELERVHGKTVREIFEQEGEGAFRSYETAILQSLPKENIVITTGGGIVGREENRNWMKEHGTVVYLYCDPAVILDRLRGDTTRPLLKQSDNDSFFQLFQSRQGFYEQADVRIDTTNRDIADIVLEMEQQIK